LSLSFGVKDSSENKFGDKCIRMIQRVKRGGKKDWTVYILRCGDGSLYTGIAKDVQARVKQHDERRGAAFTRTCLPVSCYNNRKA
jgi:hypothetical protein